MRNIPRFYVLLAGKEATLATAHSFLDGGPGRVGTALPGLWEPRKIPVNGSAPTATATVLASRQRIWFPSPVAAAICLRAPYRLQSQAHAWRPAAQRGSCPSAWTVMDTGRAGECARAYWQRWSPGV